MFHCPVYACVRAYVCASYLEGESVLARAESHVLHGGAVDHHLSHISAGHKHWAAGWKEEDMQLDAMIIMIHIEKENLIIVKQQKFCVH